MWGWGADCPPMSDGWGGNYLGERGTKDFDQPFSNSIFKKREKSEVDTSWTTWNAGTLSRQNTGENFNGAPGGADIDRSLTGR